MVHYWRQVALVGFVAVLMRIAAHAAREAALRVSRTEMAASASRGHATAARVQAELKDTAGTVASAAGRVETVYELQAMSALREAERLCRQHEDDAQCATLPLQVLEQRIVEVMRKVTDARQEELQA